MERLREITCECGEKFSVPLPDVSGYWLAAWESFVSGASCETCATRNGERANGEIMQRLESDRIVKSGIPKAFLDYDPEKGNAVILAWLRKNRNRSVYIADAYGSGKTRAVCHAGLALAKRGVGVMYCSSTDLARRVARQWRDEKSSDPVAEAQDCELLILDDLGKEKLTERAAETIFSVVDARYRDAKQLWITSNHSINGVSARMDDIGVAIARRLREMCVEWDAKTQQGR